LLWLLRRTVIWGISARAQLLAPTTEIIAEQAKQHKGQLIRTQFLIETVSIDLMLSHG
jgi:hypothetical protein